MSHEPTTAERKRITGPLGPPPAPPTRTDDRRPRPPGLWRWAILAAALALLVGGGFILTRPTDPMQDPRPVEVVRGFAAAIEARDASRMLSYAEPTIFKREISPEVRAYVEYIEEIRFENPSYVLLDSDGERAHVRWTATMHYAINLGSEVKRGTKALDTTLELSKIEGAWYLHGVKLPET